MNRIDISKLQRTLKRNLPTIINIFNIVGVVTTTALSIRAGIKIAEDIRSQDELKKNAQLNPESIKTITRKDIVKHALPAVVCAGLTTTGIVYSDRLHVRREKALSGVITSLSGYLFALQQKMAENGQKEALEGSKRAILAEKAAETLPPIKTSLNGKKLVFEPYTEQYIWTTDNDIYDAMISINKNMCVDGEVGLSCFIGLLGGKPTDLSDELGWAVDNEIQEYNWGFFGYYAPWIDISIGTEEVNGREVNYIYYEVEPSTQTPMDKIDYKYQKLYTEQDHHTYIPAKTEE